MPSESGMDRSELDDREWIANEIDVETSVNQDNWVEDEEEDEYGEDFENSPNNGADGSGTGAGEFYELDEVDEWGAAQPEKKPITSKPVFGKPQGDSKKSKFS